MKVSLGVFAAGFFMLPSLGRAQPLPPLHRVDISHQDVVTVLTMDSHEYHQFLEKRGIVGSEFSEVVPYDAWAKLGLQAKTITFMKERVYGGLFLAEDDLQLAQPRPVILVHRNVRPVVRAHEFAHYLISRKTGRRDGAGKFHSLKHDIALKQLEVFERLKKEISAFQEKPDTPIVRAEFRVLRDKLLLEAATYGFELLDLNLSEDIAIDGLLADWLVENEGPAEDLIAIVNSLRTYLKDWRSRYEDLVGKIVAGMEANSPDPKLDILLRRAEERRLQLREFVDLKIRKIIGASHDVSLQLAMADVFAIEPEMTANSPDFVDMLLIQLDLQHPEGCPAALMEMARLFGKP